MSLECTTVASLPDWCCGKAFLAAWEKERENIVGKELMVLPVLIEKSLLSLLLVGFLQPTLLVRRSIHLGTT